MRRIGVLMSVAADDPESPVRLTAFKQGLQELGWTDGGNVRIDIRWGSGEAERIRVSAAELLALAPDVVLAVGGTVVGPLLQATRTVPIVFTQTTDPVGAGFVASLARPGGNVTGFTLIEFSTSAKWLELLKEIAPNVTRAAVIGDPTLPAWTGQFSAIKTVAPSFGVELHAIDVHDAGEIDRAVTALARGSHGGLIVTATAVAVVHRNQIVALAAQHKVPAVYFQRFFANVGGLISYGPDSIEPHRRAAGYVDRILKGEKPAD